MKGVNKMATKILIVEDEEAIRGFIKVNLKRNNFEVLEAGSGEEALSLIGENVDIVLLDVMLPGMNGYEVCEKVRKSHPNMGIIILTAKGQEENRIEGLDAGADDYIVKPFSPKELLAHINALTRRLSLQGGEPEMSKNEIVSGLFKLIVDERRFIKGEEEIELRPIEFSLVKYFMENANKAIHRDEILNNVWGYNYVGDFKIVDVNIRRIRQKIETNPSEPKHIEKVWGYGYRWWGGE